VTGVYDPETTLCTGAPKSGTGLERRRAPGDNLYSDCLIALDPDTGVKKWHFQYTPHDVNDWDSTQTPMLATRWFKVSGGRWLCWRIETASITRSIA